MGVFDISQDILDRKSLTSIIIDVLLDSQPITAKQIFFKLKKRYGVSITYQGLHKRLQSLENDGFLMKNLREYSIDPSWLDSVEVLLMSLRKKLLRRDRFLSQLKDRHESGEHLKVISFDLNGAVFTKDFDDLLLRREIPRAYAAKYGLSQEEAFERVTTEYRNLWRKAVGWRDPRFWIDHFKLDVSFSDLVEKVKDRIDAYIDAGPVIKALSKKYHLVMISHAHEAVALTKLRHVGLDKFFIRVFSAGSSFRKTFKDVEMYREVCDELRVKPCEVAHVGDDFELDYKVPASLGIHSFFIDRLGRREEPFVVRDLFQFRQQVEDFESLE